MRRFRVGIIGCGPRASQHAQALRLLPEVDLVAAADPREDRLDPFCAKWEIGRGFATSEDLLSTESLDLVTIVTLPEPKGALVRQCAAAGVPVINIEKPAAYTLADLDGMLTAVAQSGSLLTVNTQMRFMEQFVAVRELVASGRLGELTSMRAGSKGHLTEQGPHVMDQLLFMNGDVPAEWVLGQCDGVEGYGLKHRAPGSTAASIQFRNGVRATLECGWLAPEPWPASGFWLQKHIEVTGTRGWAGAYVNNGWRAYLDTGEVLRGGGTWEPNAIPQSAYFRRSLEWIKDRDILHPCRAEIAALGLETLLAIAVSARCHGAVTLPLERGGDPLTELREVLGQALNKPEP